MRHKTSGILIVDKPQDITSARVISRIKKKLGVRKAGHTGTLDPMATGVMVCTINKATRLSRFFLDSHKRYEAVLKLGVETDTLDATGRIVATHQIDTVSEQAIRAACKLFEGEINQTPPIYSALKHNGVPLYKYARNGTPVTKPPGTYIRTLCADIGNALGCGGHLKELKRIECGGFGIHEAMSLNEIETKPSIETIQKTLIPMTDALSWMRQYTADTGLMEKIKYGQPLSSADIPVEPESLSSPFIKVINTDHRLLAVVSQDENKGQYNYCCVFLNP